MIKEENDKIVEAIKNLQFLLEYDGAEIKLKQYTLFYRPEMHPMDDSWGYCITNNKDMTSKSFKIDLPSAIMYLAGFGESEDIPF